MTGMCIAAANYLIERTNEYNYGKLYSERIPMTCKRLQKLLYFGDVLYMQKTNGNSMFKDEFYAWPSGPVIPSIYDAFMQFQNGEMEPIAGTHTPLSATMENVLNEIFEKTISIDTFDLVTLSHIQEGPWDKIYEQTPASDFKIIPKDSIFNFYKQKKDFLKISA